MSNAIFLYFIFGLALIGFGANYLVFSTEKLSKRFNISRFISSFIFIGLATSSPEILISILSSIENNPNIALGNALGSNIANISLVFAISILFIKVSEMNFKQGPNKEIIGFFIFLIIITSVTFIILMNGTLSRLNSIFLIFSLLPLFYLYKLFFYINNDAKAMDGESKGSLSNIIFLFFIGLISLLVGTELFLNSSIEIAKIIGISNYVVGLSITAVGTSLPELAASIESVRKKHIDFVFGNILGSNIFNITLVIGLAGLISPGDIMLQGDLPREMIMIFITTVGLALALYIIIKNYNWLITKILSLSLVVLFFAYQFSLYGISL